MDYGVLATASAGGCTALVGLAVQRFRLRARFWVAVKELELSYYIGETLLFTTYTDYGNLI